MKLGVCFFMALATFVLAGCKPGDSADVGVPVVVTQGAQTEDQGSSVVAVAANVDALSDENPVAAATATPRVRQRSRIRSGGPSVGVGSNR